MPVEVVAVEFGSAALARLSDQVRDAKGADPLAPVTVIVSSNAMGTSVRRSLAGAARGVAAVSFVTLRRLAEQLGAAALADAGRRPVSRALVSGAVRRVLADDPGVFGDVSGHPATEEALASAHGELADLSEEALAALEGRSARAKDVVRVHRRVTEMLSLEWFDEHDLVRSAARHVGATASGLGPVFVHLPRDLTRSEIALLTQLARHTSVTVNVGTTGNDKADRRARELARKLGHDSPTFWARSPRNTGVSAPKTSRESSSDASTRAVPTRVRSVSDPDEEVRAAVHELLGAMRGGVPLGRTAILYATQEPYLRLLHDQLEAAGILRNGAPVASIGDGLFARTLRTLLELPANGYRRRDVLGLLACAPIVGQDGRQVPSRAWERVSRAAGVVDGGDWVSRLDNYIFETNERAADIENQGDSEAWKAAQLRRTVADAEALKQFVADLRAELEAGDGQPSWRAAVQWAHATSKRYLGGESKRSGWPAAERVAAERVEETLERLAGLDSLSVPKPTVEVFARTLRAELDSALGRHGRLGEGVLVAPVWSAAGLTFDLVVVLGMAEGTFPVRRLEDSLLPDREREATGGELLPKSARADDELADLLAVIAGANESVLVFPRGDLRRRGERTPSRWLTGEPFHDSTGSGVEWDETPSVLGGLRARTFPATDQEYDLSALLRSRARPQKELPSISGDAIVVGDPVLRAAVDLVRARQGAAFTRFDGNLSGLDIKGPADPGAGLVSPTRLEAWTKCPHAYFVRYVLGVNPVERPERILQIDPLDRGSLVHDILETFINESLALGRPSGDWDESDRSRLQDIGQRICTTYESRGVTGRPIFWRRDKARILDDLNAWLQRDSEVRAMRGAVPLAAELSFGFPDSEIPAVEIELPDGRTIRFRGKIDRVDRTASGDLVVLDYKTGGTSRYGVLSEDNPDDNGTHLQLRVYAEAARAHAKRLGHGDAPLVHTAYWFVSTKGAFNWIGYDLTPAAEQRMSEVLATISDGITAGLFPARPTDDPPYNWTDCIYCDPDELGAHDRRREWERKSSAPAIAPYLALVEPQVAT